MGTRLEPLTIAVDGDRIAGTLLTHAARVPGVLFVHGWGGSQEQDLVRAREAVGLGCICLTFDLRGHQLMEQQRDTVTREHNLRDLIAAYDLIAGLWGVDRQSIAVIGSSYGGYLAAILTTLRPIRWLALRAPALYQDMDWELPKRELHVHPGFAAYRQTSIRPDDNRALAACASFTGDVLLVESEHDEIIPQAVIKNYVASLTAVRSLTVRVISGAGHALAGDESQRAYSKLLATWLTEMVTGAREAPASPVVG